MDMRDTPRPKTEHRTKNGRDMNPKCYNRKSRRFPGHSAQH